MISTFEEGQGAKPPGGRGKEGGGGARERCDGDKERRGRFSLSDSGVNGDCALLLVLTGDCVASCSGSSACPP